MAASEAAGRGVGSVAGRSSAGAASASGAGHQRTQSHGGKGILVHREQQQPPTQPQLPPSALKKPGKSNLKGQFRLSTEIGKKIVPRLR